MALYTNTMDMENRVVVLIDMDCFYCQVEEKLNPELKGMPIAVVQYNPWKGGGIIAVNYVARAMGVTRHMRGDEAKEKCPEIQLPSVACMRGKADITRYRDAGTEVAKVLKKFAPILERASIDEAYLDITTSVQERLRTENINSITVNTIPNTHTLGYECVDEFISDVHSFGCDSIEFDYEHTKQLLVGALIVSEIRKAVFHETGYTCSAGIAHNKILAKLVCGMNKPNKQTILPKHSINILYSTLSVKKVKHLGGKFGDSVCDVLKIRHMSELQRFTEKELQAKFDEKNGTWLFNIARGIDLEPVQAKFNPKSIGCCKQFKGKSALLDLDSLKKWLVDLGDEIEDRLEKDALENNRTPKQMVVSFSTYLPDGRDVSSSRSYNFVADDELCGELFTRKALELVMETIEGSKLKGDESNRKLKTPIKFLGISVGKFEDHIDSKKTKRIADYFAAGPSKNKEAATKLNDDNKQIDKVADITTKSNKKEGKEYILKKFFQVPNKSKEEPPNNISSDLVKENDNTVVVVETALEKQESFFAKFLNKGVNKNIAYVESTEAESLKDASNSAKNVIKPPTPVCDVINCGENSNDSDYSNSTINMEINKSIALFEEDPQDLARISNMRQLLNSTMIENEEDRSEVVAQKSYEDNENNKSVATNANLCNELTYTSNVQQSSKNYNLSKHNSKPERKVSEVKIESEETLKCPECGVLVSINMLDTHADYHLALKLREEERQQVRIERKERSVEESKKKKKTTEIAASNTSVRPGQSVKNEISSVASFLIKIDDNIPTEVCAECGKRIPVEKFTEHLDFHEARKISRELNKKSTLIHTSLSSSVSRKRKPTSPVRKQKVPCKSIDSFFR